MESSIGGPCERTYPAATRPVYYYLSDFGLVRYPSGGSPGNVLGRLPRRQDEPLACKTARRYSPSGRHSCDLDFPDGREHDRDRRLRFGRGKARVLHLMVDHHGYVDPN
jgi:hypothetical protein